MRVAFRDFKTLREFVECELKELDHWKILKYFPYSWKKENLFALDDDPQLKHCY